LIDLVEKNTYEIGEDLRLVKTSIEETYKQLFNKAKDDLIGIT
jgi:hypothetical protein